MAIHNNIRAFTLMALLPALQGRAAAPDSSVAFRVVSGIPGYAEPVGLLEGSPGVFYSAAANPAVFSVTLQGKVAGLAGYANQHEISMVASGPNDLIYSSVSYQAGDWPSNIFSVGRSAGTLKNYASDGLTAWLAGNLPDGNLFGTAQDTAAGNWSLVRSDTNGNVTKVYQFALMNILSLAPAYASDGNYYGVAWQSPGSGNYIYRVTPGGQMSTMYTLPPNSIAYTYFVPLIQANDGNFYGVTPTGGKFEYGTLYRVTPSGQYTLLYSFPKGAAAFPQALIQASDGNLYGASLGWNQSALYRLSLSGEYTVLHVMTGPEGQCQCNIIQGSDGVIYGVALNGGPYGAGSVFALDVGLPKPAPQALQFGPQHGPVGTRVRIWGYNLLNASVAFGGVPAPAVANSGPNYVWATVPAEAASGPVTVTTPGGASTTAASFNVQ